MRQWWHGFQPVPGLNEQVIKGSMTLDQTIDWVMKTSTLPKADARSDRACVGHPLMHRPRAAQLPQPVRER